MRMCFTVFTLIAEPWQLLLLADGQCSDLPVTQWSSLVITESLVGSLVSSS